MKYSSTRDNGERAGAAQAILTGLAPDGGLYTPLEFPSFFLDDIKGMCGMGYAERAARIMHAFIGEDYSLDELKGYTKAAYAGFDGCGGTKLRQITEKAYVLELWHGPTAAFKDMALQVLPYLMTGALRKCGDARECCILAATSGDTGKAALEGFSDVPGTRIMVFYPHNGVSEMQRLQMTTQAGSNVSVRAVCGNFDDTQRGVKRIFADFPRDDARVFLSSANSINWGRLVPQVAYYVSAYCDLINGKTINIGEKVSFYVPTGNFGNILAGYIAYRCGLPVEKLVCASNSNNVLTDFLSNGIYDANRPFYTTISPSMDILFSSNVERLLYYFSGMDGRAVAKMMDKLSTEGIYSLDSAARDEIGKLFSAGFCDEAATKAQIRETWNEHAYLMDPHTAVAMRMYTRMPETETPVVILSTASPYKFSASVLDALGRDAGTDAFDQMDALAELSGIEPPKSLCELRDKAERFTQVVERDDMPGALNEFLDGI